MPFVIVRRNVPTLFDFIVILFVVATWYVFREYKSQTLVGKCRFTHFHFYPIPNILKSIQYGIFSIQYYNLSYVQITNNPIIKYVKRSYIYITTSVRIIANLLLHIISAFLLQLKCIKSFNVTLLAIHIKIRVNLYRMNRMEMLCHLHHG